MCWSGSAADADRRQREEAAATTAHSIHKYTLTRTRGVERRGEAIDTPQGAVREGEEERRREAAPRCLPTAAQKSKQTKHLAHNLWAI